MAAEAAVYFDVKSPKRGAKLRLDASFFVIGRGERVPIFHDDPSISREHAAVVVRRTGVRVRDLGSKNGVLLNGKTIGRYAEVDLKPGDTIKIGATTLVLHEGEPPVRVAEKRPDTVGDKTTGEEETVPPDAKTVPPSRELTPAPPLPPDATRLPEEEPPTTAGDGASLTGSKLPSAVDTLVEAPVEDLSRHEEGGKLPEVSDDDEDEPPALE